MTKKGLTFARGLRAILRHDPDTILVGEIRDSETAGIAVQAALTGHLVLSSVHANDVFSVLERFLYMNVDANSLLSALRGVLAQRLVRGICPQCLEETQPSEQDLHQWQQSALHTLTPVWRKGRGCPACRQSGFRGRLALAEVLPFSDRMKEALQMRASVRQMREIALAEGFVPLHNVAIRAVLEAKPLFRRSTVLSLLPPELQCDIHPQRLVLRRGNRVLGEQALNAQTALDEALDQLLSAHTSGLPWWGKLSFCLSSSRIHYFTVPWQPG